MKNIFAVDIGGTAVKYALVTPDFKVTEHGEFPTPHTDADTLINAILEAAAPFAGQFDGVGVSLPGTVMDDPEGTIKRGGALPFMNDVPLAWRLREQLHVPCAVENDGKAGVLGEYASGALKGCRSGVVMVLGTGIGGGILIDGRVWKGGHFFAGEFSFISDDPTVAFNMDTTFAGRAGASGLLREVVRAKGLPEDTQLSGREIFQMANDGDEDVIAGIRAYAAIVARQVYNLQVILDPEIIAIGGGISAQPLLHQLIREEVDKFYSAFDRLDIFPPPKARVVPALNGNDANLIGAAFRCFELVRDELN